MCHQLIWIHWQLFCVKTKRLFTSIFPSFPDSFLFETGCIYFKFKSQLFDLKTAQIISGLFLVAFSIFKNKVLSASVPNLPCLIPCSYFPNFRVKSIWPSSCPHHHLQTLIPNSQILFIPRPLDNPPSPCLPNPFQPPQGLLWSLPISYIYQGRCSSFLGVLSMSESLGIPKKPGLFILLYSSLNFYHWTHGGHKLTSKR